MARYDPIPDKHRVTRWVKRKYLPLDDNGDVILDGSGGPSYVYPDAFALRVDEDYLSVTWIEFFGLTDPENFKAAANAVRKTTASGNLAKSSYFCAASSEEVVACCNEFGEKIRLLSEPVDKNEGHAGIFRFPRENLPLQDALANAVFRDRRRCGDLI